MTSVTTQKIGAPLNAPATPRNAADPVDDNDATDPEDHVSAAEAAAAYRSHDPSEAPPPPHISLEDEQPETDARFSPPPPPPRPWPAEYRSEPQPQRLKLGLDRPFSDAFSVSLGWSAGRFLFRLVMLLVVFAIIGLMLWNFMSQF